MQMRVLRCAADISVALATVILIATQGASAQCVGDCDGGGDVGIDELITLVEIALDVAPPSQCAGGNPQGGTVDITLIIQAINNALNGCVPYPSPTPTATATPTPGFPNVAGVWTEERPTLTSSNCNPSTAGVVAQSFTTLPATCDNVLTQEGPTVHGSDCQGNSGNGTIDASGVLLIDQGTMSNTFPNGCRLTVGAVIMIDLSHSPSTGQYTIQLTFAGPCSPYASCTAHAQSVIVKQPAASVE